jgi:autotransporter-associated beta strand protein
MLGNPARSPAPDLACWSAGAGDTTIASIIGTGSGNLIKDGAGTLTLNGVNTFAGGVVISEGILRAGSDLALGAVSNSVTVGSGGTLDINGRTLQGYTQHIFITGAGAASAPTLGALGNGPGGTQNLNAIRDIELTGDATVGGDGGRWDIGRIDFNADPAVTVDHITGNGFVLTKVGASYLGLLTGASNLAGFIANGGIVAPHENTSFGDGPVIVNAGTVKPWGGPTFANDFTLAGGALTEQDGFTDTYNGPLIAADATTSTLMPVNGNILLNGNISGTGALVKSGAFSVFLNGDNGAFAGSYQNDVSNTFFGVAAGGSANAAFVVNGGNLAGRTAGSYTVDLGSLAGTRWQCRQRYGRQRGDFQHRR